MPFGLKNAGATYQQCMQACLKEQIGRNIKVFVDNIVIKSVKADSLLDDLRETFTNLDRYSVKLNPKNAPSEYLQASFWATSSLREESKATQRRSRP
jgi:hypothetical protein